MATLTIRNLDDAIRNRLRLRAASRNRSMEEEARRILRAALQDSASPVPDLGARIRARFVGLGDVQLAIEAREPVREPEPPQTGPASSISGKRKPPASRVRRR